jgi:hypothetical protein
MSANKPRRHFGKRLVGCYSNRPQPGFEVNRRAARTYRQLEMQANAEWRLITRHAAADRSKSRNVPLGYALPWPVGIVP